VSATHVKPNVTLLAPDPCMRNPLAAPVPVLSGSTSAFMRIRPCAAAASCANAADANDPILATTLYQNPAWPAGGTFAAQVLSSLDSSTGSLGCPTAPSFPLSGPIRGYMVIDHINYCTISDPSQPAYYNLDAIGMENNLVGEIIYISGSGAPTYGMSTVNIESSRVFSSLNNGGLFDQDNTDRERTFYARYWSPSGITRPNTNTPAFASNPWNQGFGDEREPLGLKYAVRYFEGNGTLSYFRVWRASAGTLTNLNGSSCAAVEPSVNLSFYDEDENGIVPAGQPPCPSPCTIPPPSTQNFPLETQRTRVFGNFTLPPAFAGAQVGWMSASFVNLGVAGNYGGLLDQAWMDYEFIGTGFFVNASVPGTQLDPTTCHPLLIPLTNGGNNILVPDAITDPVTPGGASGLNTNPATATGP
jgi:hypothetical protein